MRPGTHADLTICPTLSVFRPNVTTIRFAGSHVVLLRSAPQDMIHVVLDTSIYSRNPRLDSKEFTLLQGISSTRQVTLHVPFVVEREFATQLEHDQRRRLDTAVREISNALAFDPHGPHSARLAEQLEVLQAALSGLAHERATAFIHWLEDASAIRHPLTLKQASNALDAYFSGAPPLKEPKVRKDIPDSFVFQKLLELHQTHGSQLRVVVADKSLAHAVRDAGIPVWATLREFLTSPDVQSLVAEQVIATNQPAVNNHVLALAEESTEIIAKALEEALLSDKETIQYGSHFPGDTGEIYLSGIDIPHEVHIGDIEYIGGTVFLANIAVSVELMYQYHLATHDALALGEPKYYISPLNDHYLEVETTDEFSLSACLEIEFPTWQTTPHDIHELKAQLTSPEIGVTDINDLEIIDDHVDT